MEKPNYKYKYPYIRAWGRLMSSFQYYVDNQVEQATKDNAPQDAIYRHTDGTWRTYRDIKNVITRYEIDKLVRQYL